MHRALTWQKVKGFFRHKRKPGSHKGQNGVCLVIGGSEDLVGAPALAAKAAMACLRAGVDIVRVVAPQKAGWAISCISPDLIVKKLPGKNFSPKHIRDVLKIAQKSDSIIIGPGMGRGRSAAAFAREFVQKNRAPIVIDADALRACRGLRFNSNAIITPHAKEFEAFTGKSLEGTDLNEKIVAAKRTAQKYNCIVLLKGKVDIITDGKRVFLNRTGNAGMTVGGTGDVLAGLCAGFVALKAHPLGAACAAAFVNGKIGDELLAAKGYSFIASDFFGQIPKWVKMLVK